MSIRKNTFGFYLPTVEYKTIFGEIIKGEPTIKFNLSIDQNYQLLNPNIEIIIDNINPQKFIVKSEVQLYYFVLTLLFILGFLITSISLYFLIS